MPNIYGEMTVAEWLNNLFDRVEEIDEDDE